MRSVCVCVCNYIYIYYYILPGAVLCHNKGSLQRNAAAFITTHQEQSSRQDVANLANLRERYLRDKQSELLSVFANVYALVALHMHGCETTVWLVN
jgi:hypothetical protein